MWFISRRQEDVLLGRDEMKTPAMWPLRPAKFSADPDPRRRGDRGSPSSSDSPVSTARGCFAAPAPGRLISIHLNSETL